MLLKYRSCLLITISISRLHFDVCYIAETILTWTASKALWSGIYSFLYILGSKRTIRNIVVFLTIYICTINLFLLFDNTTGMTHLKITYSGTTTVEH